jgi:sulfite reductase alpha subunit-like flavoprotein
MNTVAHHYNHALELFNRDASSHEVETATAECVSAFAATRQAVIFIGLTGKGEVSDSEQGFWKFLETYGLTVKFWERWKHDGFYMGVCEKPQTVPEDIMDARVAIVPSLAVAA